MYDVRTFLIYSTWGEIINLMNQKGFTPVFSTLSILIVLGLVVGTYYLSKKNTTRIIKDNQNALVSISPQVTASPDSKTISCDNKGQISLQKTDKTILLDDPVSNFQLNASSLPEIQKLNIYTSNCERSSYEVDMYNLRTTPTEGSTARLSVVSNLNKDSIDLKEFARKEYDYKEGTHTGKSNYGQPYTSSSLKEINLPNGQMLVSWEDIYTEEERYHEGTTAAKFYIAKTDSHIIVFSVFAWDIPNFKRATSDFDKVIATFKPLN